MKTKLLAGACATLLGVGSAAATDLTPPRAAPVAMPVKAPAIVDYNWTGFYLGAYAGLGVNHSHAYDPTFASDGALEFVSTGLTGGVTAGYNWQFNGNWVAGIEGDVGYLGLGRRTNQFNDSPPLAVDLKTSWLATVRGRFGLTNGPSMSYLTAGGAWMNVENVVADNVTGVVASANKGKFGYVIGSGVETMLGGNWTAKAETLYIDVGKGDTVTNPSNTFITQNNRNQFYVQKFGVNYLFGAGAQPLPMQGSWGGFYAGVVGGGALLQAKINDPTGTSPGEFGNNGNGYSAGAIAGFNWQFAPSLVAGVEGDFSWLGVNHGVDDYNDSLALLTVKTSWLGTVRGRLGYSTGPALFYLTGGAAWVNVKDTWDFGSGPVSSTKTLSGYAAGGGIETAMFGPFTSRTEYLFVDAGNGDTLIDPSATPVRVNHQFHLFRSSLTYRFGAGGF